MNEVSRASYAGVAWVNGDGPVAAQVIIEQQMITERTALPRQDQNWTFIDAAGHYHACDIDGEYPTLTARNEHRDCDGSCSGVCGGEGYGVTVYTCPVCEERIEPGLLHGEHLFVVPGLKDWRAKVASYVPFQTPANVRFETSNGLTLFGTAIAVSGEVGSDGATTELGGYSKLGRRR